MTIRTFGFMLSWFEKLQTWEPAPGYLRRRGGQSAAKAIGFVAAASEDDTLARCRTSRPVGLLSAQAGFPLGTLLKPTYHQCDQSPSSTVDGPHPVRAAKLLSLASSILRFFRQLGQIKGNLTGLTLTDAAAPPSP